ncbi:hypothetical protein PybrP1_006355 [[Pythium] brassicae (nom. inval.)]|nr:hypothetical protein PybrP1_006355 [[Pythium] brassicae (nom. inval.)]
MRTNLKYDVDPRTKRSSSPRLSIAVTPEAVPVAVITQHEKLSTEPSPMKLRGDPNDPHTLLKAVFHYYCRFGRTGAKGVGERTLDNANFSKLCRDSPGLLDASFASTDVDLIFIKAKKKGERRINYTRFLDALGMIAMQKYNDLAHFARLPCMLEFTNGKTVQAIWQKRAERDDSCPTADLPPLAPTSLVPPPAPVAVGSSSTSSVGLLFRRRRGADDEPAAVFIPLLDEPLIAKITRCFEVVKFSRGAVIKAGAHQFFHRGRGSCGYHLAPPRPKQHVSEFLCQRETGDYICYTSREQLATRLLLASPDGSALREQFLMLRKRVGVRRPNEKHTARFPGGNGLDPSATTLTAAEKLHLKFIVDSEIVSYLANIPFFICIRGGLQAAVNVHMNNASQTAAEEEPPDVVGVVVTACKEKQSELVLVRPGGYFVLRRSSPVQVRCTGHYLLLKHSPEAFQDLFLALPEVYADFGLREAAISEERIHKGVKVINTRFLVKSAPCSGATSVKAAQAIEQQLCAQSADRDVFASAREEVITGMEDAHSVAFKRSCAFTDFLVSLHCPQMISNALTPQFEA